MVNVDVGDKLGGYDSVQMAQSDVQKQMTKCVYDYGYLSLDFIIG